jgi:transcriptional regulator with XRE-family HTH domain
MADTHLGERLKSFRKRANLSQLELELRIGAASGSLSKIERGETNPTKETLIKIIEVLDIKPKDAARLFDINVEQDIANLVSASHNLNSLDLNQVTNGFVNGIVKELNFIGGLIWLKEGDFLKSTPFTDAWYTKLLLKLVPKLMTSISVPLAEPEYKDNYLARATLDGRVYFSEDFADFTQPMFPRKISDTIEQIMRIRATVAIPITIEGNKCIGVATAASENAVELKDKVPILEAFTRQISLTLNNINKYKVLEAELAALRMPAQK